MEIQVGSLISIQEAFSLAISEAKKGLGFVSPNPPVGCVLLDRNGKLLSVGHHRRFGGPHAEVEAVNKLADTALLKGGSAIVTLEPCAHFGKTPPCAEFLAKLGLSKVYYGLKDPNPLVAGKGLEILKDAGIEVIEAPEVSRIELELLAEAFLINQRYRECFVGVKVASSLDGMMCLENKESQWITSDMARLQGHRLRAHYGAVLTSAASLIKDNSKLNSRVMPFEKNSIPLFILDEDGKSAEFLPGSELLKVRKASEIFIFIGQKSESNFKNFSSAQVIVMDLKEGLFDLAEVFRHLWKAGVPSVMVEAGPQLTSALISQGLFHRLELFLGNKILGTNTTGSWTKGLKIESMNQTLSLAHIKFHSFAEDIWVSGRNPKSFQSLFF